MIQTTPEIITRLVDLPAEISGCVVTNEDSSYTIIINARMSHERAMETYRHELRHIYSGDFEKYDIQEIETMAHEVMADGNR